MKATARAHPNIALVKYWGKRDEALILPHQSSLSVTLSGLWAQTTVAFDADSDRGELDGRPFSAKELARVSVLLDVVRTRAGLSERARVVSRSNFPTAAGLASSAAGFAALGGSRRRQAAGLKLDAARALDPGPARLRVSVPLDPRGLRGVAPRRRRRTARGLLRGAALPRRALARAAPSRCRVREPRPRRVSSRDAMRTAGRDLALRHCVGEGRGGVGAAGA